MIGDREKRKIKENKYMLINANKDLRNLNNAEEKKVRNMEM